MWIKDNVRILREKQNLSQKKLAEKVNVAQSMIGSYEIGAKVPSLEVSIRLAAFFGVTLDELILKKMVE